MALPDAWALVEREISLVVAATACVTGRGGVDAADIANGGALCKFSVDKMRNAKKKRLPDGGGFDIRDSSILEGRGFPVE